MTLSSGESTRWQVLGRDRILMSTRGRELLVGVSASALAAAAVVVSLTSPLAQFPPALAFYRVEQILAYMLIGLLWWRRRPGNAIGSLLIVTGAFAASTILMSSTNSVLFTIGVAIEPLAGFAGFYLAVCYPQQRPQTVSDRIVASAFGYVILAMPIMLMVSPEAVPRGALYSCATACPSNALFLTNLPWLASALWATILIAAIAAATAALISVLIRLRTSTPAKRRALIPVAGVAMLLFGAFVSYQFSRWVLGAEDSARLTFEWLLVGARVIFPFGFLFALIEAEVWAGGAGRRLITQLLREPSPARWREVVAASLEDPTTNIGYLDVASGSYIDADGRDIGSEPSHGRLLVDVRKGEEVVARIVTDPALIHQPELLAAATEATVAAIEQGRLESTIGELQHKATAAGAEERRRIQRDLHDSAQQRLVALRVHMTLAQERERRPAQRMQLAQFAEQLDAALEELRAVSRGQYPSRLSTEGLAVALREAATRTSERIVVFDEGTSRHDRTKEQAVYFCCTEALQNALKHAGNDARIRVTIGDRSGGIFFSVEDDGAGFEAGAARQGTGLSNMRSRMEQVGGELSVESRPGFGTRISGTVPDGI